MGLFSEISSMSSIRKVRIKIMCLHMTYVSAPQLANKDLKTENKHMPGVLYLFSF